MREKATPFQRGDMDILEIVGTGGDGPIALIFQQPVLYYWLVVA